VRIRRRDAPYAHPLRQARREGTRDSGRRPGGVLSFGFFSLHEQRKETHPRCGNRNYYAAAGRSTNINFMVILDFSRPFGIITTHDHQRVEKIKWHA